MGFQVSVAFLKVHLKDVEIWFFFFNAHVLIIMGIKILCFYCFQNSITLDKKLLLTSGCHQFVAQTVLYEKVYKTPHVKILTLD